MAPAVGFWCFMDDLNEEMFPFASIDWCETPDVVKGEPSPGKVLSFAKSQLATKQVHQRDAVHDAESIDANVEPVPDNGESSPKKEDNKADQKLKDGTGDKGQQDKTRQTNAPIPREETLTQEVKPANSIERQLFENLSNQNRELLRGKESAIKWQDAASMAIKEAKDEAETRKQEANAAKKTGLRGAAMVQRELNDSKKEVEALKRDKVLVAKNKTRAESEHREEMSVAEGKIKELQTGLNSALDSGRESAKRSNELSQTNKELQNELAAKDKKLADKDEEKQILQGRVDARDSEIQDIRTEAGKDRKACNEYRREKFESEKAQRGAERKVGDLKQEAIKFKAKTDKAMKTLQTKVDESVARETKANARATKAEGDAEQLKRELDNTESARQTFEKKEGEWAALFAANQGGAGTPSQSALVVANAPVSEMGQPVTEQQISNTTANKLEVSKLADGKPERKAKLSKKPEQQAPAPAPGLEAQKKITELEGVVEKWKRSWEVAQDAEKAWKQTIRQELNGKYRTAVATAREKIRKELESEKQKALASERKTIREKAKCSLKARLAVRVKSHKSKELQKHRRRNTAGEGKRARSKKGQVEWVFGKAASSTGDADRSQLETQTRNQLQTEFQKELSNHKTQWEVERTAIVGSQLEVQIRNQLQTEYRKELSSFKTQWEIEHSPSKAGLESQKNAAAENQIQMDESGTSGPAAARSPEDDMLLASLSRESDETHELFQEIGRTGLLHNSGACIVLQELNQAKDAIYDVKCELWKPDAVINKNNLLQSVGVMHVNEHYIRQLDPSTREVLIRQANEANRRLEYVQKNLGTNEDVPKYAMLEALFGSPKPEPEPEHKELSAPSQTTNASLFPQKPNGLENAAAPGISASTPFRNSALPGITVFPSVTGFGNPAAPDASAFPLTFNGFGDAAASKRSETSTQGVLNPFENYHFPSQPALDSAPSASQITTKPQESAPIEPSSALLDSSMDFQLDDLSSRGSGQLPIAVTDGKGISAQNCQDSGAPDRTTEANNGHEANFKKTFGPLVPQGEDPAPPPSMHVAASPELVFNFGDFSSTAPADSSDKDHQMSTDGGNSSLPATQDHSSVARVDSVPSRPPQAKNFQAQRRVLAPKSRQALVKKQNPLASMPNQAQQTNPQEQVPANQQVGPLGLPRTAFALEPNHSFDLTLSTSHMQRGSHLRIQQDSTEYQKPLKIFQIPEEASSTSARSNGKSLDKSLPLGIMSPQVEDNIHETPLGCEGWTGEMEKHAKLFLRSADPEQVMARLHWLYPTSKSMTGLTRTLEQLKREIEAQESDQVQNERTSEQPAGWTNEMTDFVEGSLCGGNDVKATVNLLRLEKAEAFDIQGLEEHVEKLKNEHINKKNVRVQQDQVPQEPLGRPDRLTAVVQGRGLVNASKGRRLAHKAFATRQTVSSSGSTQVPQSGSQKQGIDPQEGSSGGSSQQQHPSDQPNGWTDKLTNIVREELRLSCDVGVDFLGHVLRYNHDFETNDIQCLNKYLEKLRQEVKAEQVHRSDGPKKAEDKNISGIGGVGKIAENLKNEHKTQVPEMPVWWTDVMTDTVKDMLRLGDDIGFIEEVIKEDLDLQTTNPASLEKWFKKLESDYEAEVEDRMEQE